MARPTGISISQLSDLRTVTAADNATLTDANIPTAQAIDCSGFDTILVGVEFTAGTTPTATVEALFRDADAADGARWKRVLLGAKPGITAVAAPGAAEDTGALDGTALSELLVFGRKLVFLRVKAITGTPTNVHVLVTGGRTRNIASLNRS